MVKLKVLNIPYLLFLEPHTYFFFALITAILALAYFKETYVGIVYLALLAADYFQYKSKTTRYNFFSNPGNTVQALVYAVVAYFGIVLITGVSISVLQSTSLSFFKDVPQRIAMATFGSTTPILSEVPVITVFVFAVFIPVIETRTLVGRYLEWLADLFKTNLSLVNFRTWLIMVVIGVTAVVFHWQVKGVTNFVDLFITFIFFAGSGVLVLLTGEMESPVYLHIINNFVGVKSIIGL